MAVSVHDYLIDQAGVDWASALAGWSWLVPSEFTLWLVNRLCDLFLVAPDGAVHMLDVGAGTLTRLADSRDHFGRRLDEEGNTNEWFAIPLVDTLVASGMVLQPGQCYGFKLPPVLGGPYTVEKLAILPIADYLGACGSIHNQLREVPDGSQVVLKAATLKPHRERIAFVSACLFWLALNTVAALPLLLDMKSPLVYLAGVLLFLEPLFIFWARYQYRYMLRADSKPEPRDELA